VLNCRESGSTLRFLLPVVGALGVDATFQMSGRLPNRPLSPLWEVMEANGCSLSRPTKDTLHCAGKLMPANYSISGNISSQYITGLLFAMALMSDECKLTVTGKLESAPYILMTQQAMSIFGVPSDNYQLNANSKFHTPGKIRVEGDWSNGAFFLGAQAIGNFITVDNLNAHSPQGDKAIIECLNLLNDSCTISCEDFPDLVPILAVVAGCKNGATFTGIQRLRLKESDRVESVAAMLRAFGATVTVKENELTVYPAQFISCTINAMGDHRIAMAAAIGATAASGPVTIWGANCVSKSATLNPSSSLKSGFIYNASFSFITSYNFLCPIITVSIAVNSSNSKWFCFSTATLCPFLI
jgi:3-phosphoshikimate 1-carboxyvinyltransferase